MVKISGLLFVTLLAMTLTSAGVASGQIHFTTPILSFEQAVATAKQAGKPLVVEFSATWCGPCKLMARDFSKAKAKSTLDLVHLVVYDGSDDELGSALMTKLGLSSFPALVAFDSEGQEVSRRQGYGRWPELESWLKELPEQAIPLAQLLLRAAAMPNDAKLQLDAAQRLARAERYAEARGYYARARHGKAKEAAIASWAMLQLDSLDQERKVAKTKAEQLAAQYPGTKEAGSALEFLASLPNPPVALLEKLLAKHASELKEPPRINSLIYVAMKAGAFKAALQMAAKLEPFAKDNPGYLDTLAEVAFYAEGNSTKALEIEQRALVNASSSQKTTFSANLQRFARDKKEPSDELVNFRAPRLTPEPSPRRGASRRPAWLQAVNSLNKTIRDSCWQLAGTMEAEAKILVVAAAKPAEHRALFTAAAPRAWSMCALKFIQAVDLPEGEIVTLRPEVVPHALAEQLDLATAAAEDGCLAEAKNIRDLTVAVSGEPGKSVSLIFSGGGSAKAASIELRACIERAFSTLRPPSALLQTLSLRFDAE